MVNMPCDSLLSLGTDTGTTLPAIRITHSGLRHRCRAAPIKLDSCKISEKSSEQQRVTQSKNHNPPKGTFCNFRA